MDVRWLMACFLAAVIGGMVFVVLEIIRGDTAGAFAFFAATIVIIFILFKVENGIIKVVSSGLFFIVSIVDVGTSIDSNLGDQKAMLEMYNDFKMYIGRHNHELNNDVEESAMICALAAYQNKGDIIDNIIAAMYPPSVTVTQEVYEYVKNSKHGSEYLCAKRYRNLIEKKGAEGIMDDNVKKVLEKKVGWSQKKE